MGLRRSSSKWVAVVGLCVAGVWGWLAVGLGGGGMGLDSFPFFMTYPQETSAQSPLPVLNTQDARLDAPDAGLFVRALRRLRLGPDDRAHVDGRAGAGDQGAGGHGGGGGCVGVGICVYSIKYVYVCLCVLGRWVDGSVCVCVGVYVWVYMWLCLHAYIHPYQRHHVSIQINHPPPPPSPTYPPTTTGVAGPAGPPLAGAQAPAARDAPALQLGGRGGAAHLPRYGFFMGSVCGLCSFGFFWCPCAW